MTDVTHGDSAPSIQAKSYGFARLMLEALAMLDSAAQEAHSTPFKDLDGRRRAEVFASELATRPQPVPLARFTDLGPGKSERHVRPPHGEVACVWRHETAAGAIAMRNVFAWRQPATRAGVNGGLTVL